jgi:hypothetical protein
LPVPVERDTELQVTEHVHSGLHSVAKLLKRDEARRIAANIAKLAALLG